MITSCVTEAQHPNQEASLGTIHSPDSDLNNGIVVTSWNGSQMRSDQEFQRCSEKWLDMQVYGTNIMVIPKTLISSLGSIPDKSPLRQVETLAPPSFPQFPWKPGRGGESKDTARHAGLFVPRPLLDSPGPYENIISRRKWGAKPHKEWVVWCLTSPLRKFPAGCAILVSVAWALVFSSAQWGE